MEMDKKCAGKCLHSKFTAWWLSWFDIYDTVEGKNQHIFSLKLSFGYTKECLIWPKALSIYSTTQKARYSKYDPNKFLIKDRKYRSKFLFWADATTKKTQQIEVVCSLANSLFLTRKNRIYAVKCDSILFRIQIAATRSLQ